MMRTCKTVAGSAAALIFACMAGNALAQGAAPVAAAPQEAAPPPNQLAEGVAAIVNDQIISTYDLRQRMRLLMVTSGVQPTQQALQQLQQEALRSLIDERLELQEIKREEKEQKFKIVADDDDVKHEIDRIASGNRMTGDQLLKALAGAGVGQDTMKEQIRAQMSWARWIQGRYGGSRMKVSQDQINAVLRQLQAEAAKPQFQISEIFLDASRVGGQNVAQDGANQLIAQLQKGAPFPAVARQFSSATTAANGGDAGWLAESQLQPEVREVVEQMRPGQLSAPIPVRDGVYIIYLRDKRSGSGSEMVNLKQAAISLPAGAPADQVEAARQKLIALKGQIKSCADVDAKAGKLDGVLAGDLGEADVKDLAPAFRDAIQGLTPGQVSDPIRTEAGLHLIAVCGRRQGGLELPSRDEIESRLEDQQLSLVSRRYLRDLKNSATIEFP
ncbi:peptidylprolyl isomerase [Phenylobacterium montanum]|uniref:Parvulin-like PPIase n=2 Tax=Phenylobacterium montanum TaxID=2823693 RepID=A0A975IX34_9CAUL|nr:peptidylprolyl isomerase [Caulobacter sp. S6]